MNKTSIEWTDYTSNLIKYRDPEGRTVHGCIKVSPGCANCYASAWSARGLTGERDGAFTAKRQATLTPYFDDAEAQRILRTRVTGKRVFVGDMTDVFGEWVPDALLDRMFAVFAMRPDLTFQLLTKRPERMRAYLSALDIQGYLLRQARSQLDADGCLSDQVWRGLKATLTDEQTTWIKTVASTRHMSWLAVIRDFGIEPPRASGPLPNVWLGVSVENQAAAAKRIPALLDTPAAVRSLSCEPLLEPVDLEPWLRRVATSGPGWRMTGGSAMAIADIVLDWVIVGGESGPGARPCDVGWIRDIVGQCRAAEVPVFVKQLGAWGPCQKLPSGVGCFVRAGDVVLAPDGKAWPVRADLTCEGEGMGAAYRKGVYRDRKGGDPDEWPEDLRMRQYPDV